MKMPLQRTLTFADDQKIWEMAKRGGFTLNIAGRQELEARSAKEWAESGWILRQSNMRSCGARTDINDDAGMGFVHHATMFASSALKSGVVIAWKYEVGLQCG